jgi:putative chitinase
MEMPLEEVIEWCADPEGACWSAGWFWDSRELNQWADKGDILTTTKKINGGTIGLKDREEHYHAALELFR